ncbi:MAG TPA: DNA-binding response regulator [Bacteroidales bacterium]|nr:MAG: DNA-binding response regulator [Bacteroidetes bacterium GWE2_42_24]PKP16900.1 MAG: DNA-binding response regulator [Bacteroidetes bacterium HGW-Bacteroidetes-22]HBZ65474.1 DNA-binding response regulator [Bacteroidales bacterium]
MRTIAIDDEPLALKLVTGYIIRTPFLELAASFDNPVSAIEFLQQNEVDAIFLDIQMPHLSGTEFARLLNGGAKIIFTTAFEQYAIEGFKLDVVDYLLKPFGYEEFLRAAMKLRDRMAFQPRNEVVVEANNDFLFLKSDYKIHRINFNEILYVEGLKDYVKVFLYGQPRPLLSLTTLKAMESRLPAERFMRVHRSFIVNLNRIELIERQRIIYGEIHIPVSDQYKEIFQAWVEKNFV